MAQLDIILAPDPRLKIICRPVDTVDDELRRLMADMLETMYAAPGIGLSAPQVGDDRRIIVADVARDSAPRQPLQMANPRILETSADLEANEEGCLSFPEQYAEVERPQRVCVGYLDETGAARESELEGLLATCIQHEIDHLDGIVFVDHVTALRRNMILRKMKKVKRVRAKQAA